VTVKLVGYTEVVRTLAVEIAPHRVNAHGLVVYAGVLVLVT